MMTGVRSRIIMEMLLFVVLLCAGFVFSMSEPAVAADSSTDVYFHTPGVPSGPTAPAGGENRYPQYGSLDNRLMMWFVIQQHTYFGGFVLALPIFCVLLEFLGLIARTPALKARYDGLAQDLLKVALLALSVTAAVGSVMLTMFIALYPDFMRYMGGTFKVMMPLYALVFVGTTFLTIAYYYSWDRMAAPGTKWMHLSLGLLAVAFGTSLLLLANAWSAFMMAPAGVDGQGRYLGNPWHLLHSALWNPLNLHRFLADIMSGGAVVLAYACYRFFTGKSLEERAYYDWVGYVFLFATLAHPE